MNSTQGKLRISTKLPSRRLRLDVTPQTEKPPAQQQLAQALRTTRVSVARYEAGMRRIPGMVKVAIDRLGRAPEIPMAGMVAAGFPIEPVQQSELIDVPPSMLQGGKTFALRVKGESMKDDGILPGDLIVVRKEDSRTSSAKCGMPKASQ